MTLKEAIKIKEIHSATGEFIDHSDLAKADRLLIEAGKREEYNRQHQPYLIFGPLPGETKE